LHQFALRDSMCESDELQKQDLYLEFFWANIPPLVPDPTRVLFYARQSSTTRPISDHTGIAILANPPASMAMRPRL
jgi:hypothetical protein